MLPSPVSLRFWKEPAHLLSCCSCGIPSAKGCPASPNAAVRGQQRKGNHSPNRAAPGLRFLRQHLRLPMGPAPVAVGAEGQCRVKYLIPSVILKELLVWVLSVLLNILVVPGSRGGAMRGVPIDVPQGVVAIVPAPLLPPSLQHQPHVPQGAQHQQQGQGRAQGEP